MEGKKRRVVNPNWEKLNECDTFLIKIYVLDKNGNELSWFL